jgi:predicted CoA-binding protein
MLQDESNDNIKEILKNIHTIAVVGASDKPERDSFKVMQFLIERGYKVFPINPNLQGKIILNQKCLSSLNMVDKKIDMVEIFRQKNAVMEITKEAIDIGAKVLWTQLNVVDYEAAEIAEKAGLKVIMNRCPKIELTK